MHPSILRRPATVSTMTRRLGQLGFGFFLLKGIVWLVLLLAARWLA